MKKLVALSLVFVMLMSGFAIADDLNTKYGSTLIPILCSDYTRDDLMDSEMLPITAAVIMLDYFLNCPYDAETVISPLSGTGNGYIAAVDSNSIDVFYLRSDGTYMNILCVMGDCLYDNGIVAEYNPSSEYTYYEFSCAYMISAMNSLVSALSD